MKIGAHVSIAGSLDLAIDRAVEIGAECIQIFGSAPQQWQFLLFPEEQIRDFNRKAKEYKISPIFVHSIYLINLASENPYILNNSITSIAQYLNFSGKINAEGVIFHIGSHKGAGWKAVKEQVFRVIAEILKRTPLRPSGFEGQAKGQLILENSAGAGGIIGAKFSELGEIVKAVKDPRLKVCLDTAHAFESGYSFFASPLREWPKKHSRSVSGRTRSLNETLEEFDKEIGLDRLVAVHANDSKTPFASGVDRHENIGQGYIGEEGFKVIINHPALRHLPFIIETPRLWRGSARSAGFDDRGVDRKNLETLRRSAAESCYH